MPDKWAQYAQPAPTDKWAQYAAPSPAARVAGLPDGVDLPGFTQPQVQMTPSLLGKDAGPSGTVANLAKGAVKSIPGTLSGIDNLVAKIPGVGTALTTPLVGNATSAQARADLAQAAQTHGTAQAIGKGLGNAAQFLIPGPAEEALAAKAAPLVGKALPFVKAGLAATGSGAVNAAQGGTFTGGAIAGGIGAGIGMGLKAVAPAVVESALKVRGADRAFGSTPGRAILDETSGLNPAKVVNTARTSMSAIGKDAADLAANATQPVDLTATRLSASDALNQAALRGNEKVYGHVEELNNQLTNDLASGAALPAQVPAPRAVLLKQGLGDLKTSWNPATASDFANGAVGNAYHTLGNSIEDAVPGMKPLNQRMQSLMPVVARGTAADLNAGWIQRGIGRLSAHTGALALPLGGAYAGAAHGGALGAVAGGLGTLAGTELLSSPATWMAAGRAANAPATSLYAIPAARGALMQFGRKKADDPE